MKKSFNSNDRFGIMVLVATAVHAILILTVGFSVDALTDPERSLPKMEIILVHHSTEKENKKADYLAQANNEGGGNQQEKVRPKSPTSTPNVLPVEGDAQQRQQASSPEQTKVLEKQVMVQRRSKTKTVQPTPGEESPVQQPVTSDQLVMQSFEMARLSAEIDISRENQAQKPEHKYISASTQEYTYASYMEAWRLKIENIGKLNFPDEAIRKKLFGDLILDVGINADGTIFAIKVLKSSGHKVLDDSAIRIARMAAPYAELTDEIKKEHDVLHIVRTWQFMKNRRIRTRQ
ncbi:MAG: energy transducer TonB [Methylococcales bacterium]|jgi:periplasmic protein TonB|nr:energy transducer TonB [Methylococcales bacterium]